jgi:hypothetical protein
MKFFFIITTSLIPTNFDIRKKEYMTAINKLYLETEKYKDYDKEYIIIENNGKRDTFLNEEFKNMTIVYTENNKKTANKGIKELLDIKYIFDNFDIKDDDFIIKITGRYIVNENSNFLKKLFIKSDKYDCFVKTGSIINHNEKKDIDNFDCYTGLFAIKYKFIKNELAYYLNNHKDFEWVEWIIIAIIHKNIPNDKIKFMKMLDVFIKTIDMNTYNLV